MAGARKPIDWPGIEADYRKTDTPVRELAKWYRTDESGIRARAKRYGWTRKASASATPALVSPTNSRAVERRVERAVETIVAVADKPPATCASDLLLEAYATLREVMAGSKFDAPRVSAARAVAVLAAEEDQRRAGHGAGKKALRQAGAEKAASEGRFAVPQPPRSAMQ